MARELALFGQQPTSCGLLSRSARCSLHFSTPTEHKTTRSPTLRSSGSTPGSNPQQFSRAPTTANTEAIAGNERQRQRQHQQRDHFHLLSLPYIQRRTGTDWQRRQLANKKKSALAPKFEHQQLQGLITAVHPCPRSFCHLPPAMDEVAFVESLFAPEMRTAVASSLFPSPPSSLPSCGRVKTLMAERALVPTPPSSNGNGNVVPPPPNSLLGGGIALSQYQTPFQQPTSEDAPLFVRLNEDDMFSQMLNDQDFPYFHANNFKKEQEKVPTSTNSLLLEPFDLPRSNGDQSLKDTFYNVSENSPMNFQQFRTPTSSSGAMRGGICSVSSASSNGFGLDSNMMPVFPLASQPYFGGSAFSSFPPMSPATQTWIQETQDVSTPGSNNFQRVHTMKHMMAMTSMGMSSAMMQHQPSPGSVDMFNPQHQAALCLWHSTSKSNQSEASISATGKPAMMKSLDTIKTSVERPPFSLTISPPASLTNKAFKELIVSADFGTPPMVTRPKRSRTDSGNQPKAKAARTTSASPVSQENNSGKANVKITKGKKCIEAGCTRRAQSNSRCKAHGGGARCQYSGPGGCTRSSQGGGFCRAHGGGKRCEFTGCTRGQQRKGRCYVHGGIRKCQFGNCEKKDRGNGFCISHGGGKRCEHPGCSRAVRRGLLCQIHETQNVVEKEQGESIAL